MIRRFVVIGVLLAVLSMCMFYVLGCGAPEVELNVQIAPNETAFVIPLEGATGAQAKFASAEYLEEMKVAAKRIILPQRKQKTGRYKRNYKWIPTAIVIKVSREPESREWTDDPATGTGPRDEALHMESKDGINFYTGVVITARITELNTATFLYTYPSGKLSQVLDRDVRSAAQEKLAREFGKLDQTACNEQKSETFATVKAELIEKFTAEGITITTFGQQGGFMFVDQTIQDAINKKFSAELDKKTAVEEEAAQVTRNSMAESKAESDRKVAEEYAKQQKAQQEIKQLEIQMVVAEALKTSAEQGQPIVPQVSGGAGGGMIYQMLAPSLKTQ